MCLTHLFVAQKASFVGRYKKLHVSRKSYVLTFADLDWSFISPGAGIPINFERFTCLNIPRTLVAHHLVMATIIDSESVGAAGINLRIHFNHCLTFSQMSRWLFGIVPIGIIQVWTNLSGIKSAFL